MKKNVMRWWIIWAVLLVVYNVIVFAVPFPKNAVFYVSWAFTLIALGAQIHVFRTAFYRQENAKSRFYGFPIVKIGAVYLAAQAVLGLVFMALGLAFPVPVWLPLMLYIVLSGAAAVGLISVETTRDEIVRQDGQLKKDVSRMRALQSQMASIVRLAQDDSTRTALEQFAEDMRFSDPVSSEPLQDIEADLADCVAELQRAMADGDTQGALALVQKARMLLAERNRLCKLEKGSSR